MSASIWAPGTAVTASGSIAKQAFVATASQTLFNLTAFTYEIGTGSIAVFVSGLKQRPGVDFTETSVSSFTLDTPVAEGTIVFAEAYTEITSEIPVVGVTPTGVGANNYIAVNAGETAFVGKTPAQVLADIGAEPADATILKDADIGVTVQAQDSTLSDLSAIVPATGDIIYFDGANWIALANVGSLRFSLKSLGPGLGISWEEDAFTNRFVSSAQTITTGGALSIAHGLGIKPRLVNAWLVCQTAELGYSIADEVFVVVGSDDSYSLGHGFALTRDATNLEVRFGSDANVFAMPRKDTGARANLTNANWKIVFQASA
jgi:hypothetical protein